MTEIIIAVAVAAIGSSGLFGLITFLISRADAKKGGLAKLTKKIEVLERDNCRTQMLLLMSDYPAEVTELMRVAKHYFIDLGGNWYLSTVFTKHCKNHDIDIPTWAIDKQSNDNK